MLKLYNHKKHHVNNYVKEDLKSHKLLDILSENINNQQNSQYCWKHCICADDSVSIGAIVNAKDQPQQSELRYCSLKLKIW